MEINIHLIEEKIRTIRWLSANNSDYTSLVHRKEFESLAFGSVDQRSIQLS